MVIPNCDNPEKYYQELCYWRKSNAIHNWFVKNVQNGIDDNRWHKVSLDDLKQLKSVCETVIAHSKIPASVLLDNDAYYSQPIKDPTVAKKLLPTADGFFFGETSYNGEYDGGAEDISGRTDIKNSTLAIKGISYSANEAAYLLLTGFTADVANKKTINIKDGQYLANFVNYEETLPSYQEVYTYYAKNKLNLSDSEIQAHITKVIALGADIAQLDQDLKAGQSTKDVLIYGSGQITHTSGEAHRDTKNPDIRAGMDSNRLWYIYEGEQYGASDIDMIVSAYIDLHELVKDYPEQLLYYAQNHPDKFTRADVVTVEVADRLFGDAGTKLYFFKMKHVDIEISQGPCLLMGYGDEKSWADTCKIIISGQ